MEGDGSGQVRLTAGPDDRAPRWSADGARIAFTRCAGEASTCDIWIMDGDGTDPFDVTGTPGVGETSPAWSPDGEQIVMVRDGHLVIRDLLDGSELPLTSGPRVDTSPVWSPDGTTIAYSTDGFVATIRPDGTDSQIFSIAGEVGDWSPDSQQLVIALDNGIDPGPIVATLDRHGSNLVELTDPEIDVPDDPRWSPDGSRLLYIDIDGFDRLITMDVDGTHRIGLDVGAFTSADWQPVGPRTPTFPPVTPITTTTSTSSSTTTVAVAPTSTAPRPSAAAPRFTG